MNASAPSLASAADASAPSADGPLLLRNANDGKAAAMLHGIGLRFAAELQKHLRQMGAGQCHVSAKPIDVVTSFGWAEAADDHFLWQFSHSGRASPMALAMTPGLLRQLVDIFYGGTGARVEMSKELSFAENRFAARYGDELAKLLAFAWRDAAQVASPLEARFTTARNPLAADGDGGVLVQPLALSGAPFGNATLLLACHADCMTDGAATSNAPLAPSLPPIDKRWLHALHASLGSVSLPVTSVLARPEISVGRMLTLAVGDIIPLTLPRQVPVLVGGRTVASGTLGEVDGRVAINIETLRQRNL
jgi:flagellar motor switch protein FliM